MNEQYQQEKSTFGSVLLGVMIALLIVVALAVGYYIYNTSVNSANEYGIDWFHRFNYSQAVKQCGSRYLNVKWPLFTDTSWAFQPYEHFEEEYVIGTCKVTAEGNPEKIDVACVFRIDGRNVENAFFAAGDKVYHDGIGFTRQLLNEILNPNSSDSSSQHRIITTTATAY